MDTDSVTVTVNPLPAIDAGTDASICAGETTSLNATGGITYSWSPAAGLSGATISNPDATPGATTTYTVTGTDINGCQNTDDVTVTIWPLPVADAGADVTICEGETTTLNGDGGTTYNWSPTAGLSDANIANPDATPAASTTFTLTVTDANGCSVTDDVEVFVSPLPVADAGSDVTIFSGENTQLTATGGITYSWSPMDGLDNENIADPIASPLTTTTYTVTIIDAFGCESTDEVTVFVENFSDIFLPNAFSPNDDGANDVFAPIVPSDIEVTYFAIYNRWGKIIYEGAGTTSLWDGTYEGKEQELGAYIFRIEAVTLSGEKISKSGSVTLLR